MGSGTGRFRRTDERITQAVAAEYNSGRNMEAWYRELQVPEETGRMFVKECRRVGLIGVTTPTDEISKALATQMAAREYAKAEPEVIRNSNVTQQSQTCLKTPHVVPQVLL